MVSCRACTDIRHKSFGRYCLPAAEGEVTVAVLIGVASMAAASTWTEASTDTAPDQFRPKTAAQASRLTKVNCLSGVVLKANGSSGKFVDLFREIFKQNQVPYVPMHKRRGMRRDLSHPKSDQP
jgi:hypothetical protein